MILDTDAYNRILDDLHEGLYITDLKRVIQYWNKAAEKISGFSADAVVGKSCADNILTHVDGNGLSLCLGGCPLAFAMADGKVRESEVFLHHKDGHRVPVHVRASPLIGQNGAVIGGAELFTDVSNAEAIELRIKELEGMALLDNLTQLANRHYIEKELMIRFAEHGRNGISFGVLFMDIDYFKKFNDIYGHDIGDRVLKFVADTLTRNSRPFDLVGRWGGEEFIGIIRNVTSKQLEYLGDRLRVLVEESYLLQEKNKLNVTLSMGATLIQDNDTAETLIKRADTLLYESKRQGRNRLTLG